MRLVVLYLIPFSSYSQSNKTFKVGDSMPAITSSKIFNNPGGSISLNDYQGKLIILDFWNKWCHSCIEAFPKMEKIQKEFADKVKIVLVTSDTNKDLLKLFKRVKLPDLPIISDDSILNAMFPHVTVPHHVWINADGEVIFITDGYNTTPENVSRFLEGKEINLHLKSEATDIDNESDLWKEGNGRLQKYINNYSFGMTKINEIGYTLYSFNKDTINKTYGFKFVNTSLLDIYKIAFGSSVALTDNDFIFENRIVFSSPECLTSFKYPDNTDSIPAWEARNLVCYESKWNLNNENLAYQYLQDDVNRFFSFSVSIENKETDCYTLKKINSLSHVKPGDKETYMRYIDLSYHLKNKPVSVLIQSLNGMNLFKDIPLIDETYYTENIDINLINAFSDISTLKIQLLRFGFILEKEKRKIRLLVIRPK